MAWSKKTKTIVWVSIGALLLIILIIVLASGKSKAETPPTGLPSDQDKAEDKKSSGDQSTVQVQKEIFPLKYGKRGKEVEQAQIYLLKEWGAQFPKFGIDGVWKQETEDNMVKFLKKNSISKDFYLKTGMDKIKTSTFK